MPHITNLSLNMALSKTERGIEKGIGRRSLGLGIAVAIFDACSFAYAYPFLSCLFGNKAKKYSYCQSLVI